MPIFKHYDAELNVLYEAGTGVVTLDELVEYRRSLLELPLKSGLRCIAEYSKAKVDLDYRQVFSLGDPTKEVVGDKNDFKVAIHTEDDHGFGIARMYDNLHADDRYQTMVFRNFGEACEWLGIDEPTAVAVLAKLLSQ